MWQNSKSQIVTKLKTQIVTKLKNSNCDKTQFFLFVTKLDSDGNNSETFSKKNLTYWQTMRYSQSSVLRLAQCFLFFPELNHVPDPSSSPSGHRQRVSSGRLRACTEDAQWPLLRGVHWIVHRIHRIVQRIQGAVTRITPGLDQSYL